MAKTFFTSDHHFGHANILRYCPTTRPYRSVDDMNVDYWAKWNEVVGPDDTVWYLGDFSLKFTQIEAWLPQLNGHKKMLLGNHDAGFKTLTRQQTDRYLASGFESVGLFADVELDGVRFAMSHFPYRVPERYLSKNSQIAERQWKCAEKSLEPRARSEDALLHGHIHQHWRGNKLPARLPALNVGVDAWDGAPVEGSVLVAAYWALLDKKRMAS